MPRQKLLITAFLILLLCCPMLVKAQQLTATLTGTVTDPSGAVIADAQVTIAQNGVNGVSRTVHTDARGSYTATTLPAGNYTVTFTADGFKTYSAQDTTLYVAQTRSVDAKLQPGTFTQTCLLYTSPSPRDRQ